MKNLLLGLLLLSSTLSFANDQLERHDSNLSTCSIEISKEHYGSNIDGAIYTSTLDDTIDRLISLADNNVCKLKVSSCRIMFDGNHYGVSINGSRPYTSDLSLAIKSLQKLKHYGLCKIEKQKCNVILDKKGLHFGVSINGANPYTYNSLDGALENLNKLKRSQLCE